MDTDKIWSGSARPPGRLPKGQREDCRRRFWTAIASGRSSEDAAIDAGVSPVVGVRWFRRAGGMPPTHFSQSSKPPSGRYLSFAEREEIAILRAQGHGVRAIAGHLGRPPSTISRELRRNAATPPRPLRSTERRRLNGMRINPPDAQSRRSRRSVRAPRGNYVQEQACRYDRHSGRDACSPARRLCGRGVGRASAEPTLGNGVGARKQISRRLRLDFPEDETMRISHEAIYQALYVQGREALRRELTACLRTGRALRMPRARTRKQGRKSSFLPRL